MAAPAGPCEWCGGPQWWTAVRGELWVLCKGGCLALPELEEELPPDSASVGISSEPLGVASGTCWE